MGFQILHRGNTAFIDAYLNWQSYQFDLDSHQEAFTVGVNTKVRLSHHDDGFSLLAAVVAQHRGGEQDLPELNLGVQTLCNGALGVAYGQHPQGTAFDAFQLQANLLACYQQAGELWPFDTGVALHAEARATVKHDVDLSLGVMHAPKQFVSVYGNPFFSTLSIKEASLGQSVVAYYGLTTAYGQVAYSHTFARAYTFGAGLEAYYTSPKGGKADVNVAFGAYLRVNPSFLLK